MYATPVTVGPVSPLARRMRRRPPMGGIPDRPPGSLIAAAAQPAPDRVQPGPVGVPQQPPDQGYRTDAPAVMDTVPQPGTHPLPPFPHIGSHTAEFTGPKPLMSPIPRMLMRGARRKPRPQAGYGPGY